MSRCARQFLRWVFVLLNFRPFAHHAGLKKFLFHPGAAVRPLLAVGGGILLSIAFPGVGLAGAAWVAPGVILFSAVGCRGAKAFRLGYLAGFAHFLSSLYWLVAMPDKIYGIPVGPICAWVALSAYCALFPAVWVWLCWRIWGPSREEIAWRTALNDFFAAGLIRRGTWAFNAAVVWVALEMARGHLLTGFPWNFVGASQYKMLPVIQIASLTGVCGVSFVVVWTAVALGMAMISLVRQPGRVVWGEAGVPLLTAVILATYGTTRLTRIEQPAKELSVAMVQPAFEQTLIWSSNQDKTRLEKVIALSAQALAGDPNLLLWPEGAVPPILSADYAQLAGLLDLARHKTWLAFSTDDEETSGGHTEFFNGAAVLSPAGEGAGVYHKRRLVIFGEYVPSWLSFLKWVTPIDGGFTPGRRPVQFAMKNPDARFSVLICFEDTFADEAREHVLADTDFLVNLSNDGWFGNGVQPWQQAANAVFRAVENGVPLVRCTNNGLTCWIDAQGRMREIFSTNGSIYGEGTMTVKIPLRSGSDAAPTYYNIHGDWFGWSCCGLAFCLAALSFRRPSVVN